jgi:DNA-binding MarR family transcriptional regulator
MDKPDDISLSIDLSGIDDRYYLFGVLAAFANRMQTVGDSVFEEVTWKQWFALLGASILQPSPSVSQVAGFVGTSHQNMKRLLVRLQAAGLVCLKKDEADRRRTLVTLTSAVDAFDRKYRKRSSLFIDSLFEGISNADLATARLVLDRLNQNLQVIADEMSRQESST